MRNANQTFMTTETLLVPVLRSKYLKLSDDILTMLWIVSVLVQLDHPFVILKSSESKPGIRFVQSFTKPELIDRITSLTQVSEKSYCLDVVFEKNCSDKMTSMKSILFRRNSHE